jgi:hypothetical protein
MPARSDGNRDYPLGYDADKNSYFNRINTFDNSIQVGVDAGWAVYNSPLAHPEEYRSTSDFTPSTHQMHIGVMGEKNFFKAYSSVAVGLSYMMLSTDMFGWPLSRGSGYVVAQSDDNMVSYALVKNVSTSTSYISIPIEGKYELICNKYSGVYLKAAFRTAIKLGTRTYFNALPTASAETKKRLEDFFKNDNSLFANANAYVGMRWGSYDEANFRLELGVPIGVTRQIANLQVKQGFSLRFAFLLPLSTFYR